MRTLHLSLVLSIFVTACGGNQAVQPSAEIKATETLFVVPTESYTPFPTASEPTEIPTSVPGILFVDPATSLGMISPMIYGSNYGPWTAIQFEQIPVIEALDLSVIRWPGGEWGDTTSVTHFQVDQFMGLLEQLGEEASIHVRLRDGTAEQAAELVRYVNIEKDYNVKFWAIGNEPSLYSGYMGRDYGTEEFNRTWREFAEAMKAVDPSIVLIGPEIHQFTGTPDANPKDSQANDWMIEFLKANGDLVDIVSFHRYPFPTTRVGGNATIETLRQNVYEWDETIAYLRAQIHEITGHDIPIAITEVSSHYSHVSGGEATPDSHFHAIWWGEVLRRLMHQDVLMVNQWLLSLAGGQGAWGLVSRFDTRPSYYTYAMFEKFGEELLYSSSDDPLVSIAAARHGDGALTLLIINLGDEAVTKEISLWGRELGEIQVWLFDETHKGEDLGQQTIPSEGISLTRHSITLLIIEE